MLWEKSTKVVFSEYMSSYGGLYQLNELYLNLPFHLRNQKWFGDFAPRTHFTRQQYLHVESTADMYLPGEHNLRTEVLNGLQIKCYLRMNSSLCSCWDCMPANLYSITSDSHGITTMVCTWIMHIGICSMLNINFVHVIIEPDCIGLLVQCCVASCLVPRSMPLSVA